ncbi:hypothetical protein [Methanoplanus endosymbiosus]|uniref:Uncharacterized protein n=1 Tax=Methanoplanus endosymbiosus TaxID=33865 RepID=A0A9E7TJ15_9EURY|nr:hypothetical protein [Methanoplanus endosymbiosus]UUX91290.1 hypothetical protein L6E24_07835 [Methanoplanus endosymbiosus]
MVICRTLGVKFSAVLVILAVLAVLPASGACSPDEWVRTFSGTDTEINSVWQNADGTYIAGGSDEYGRVIFGLDASGQTVQTSHNLGGDENGSVRFVEASPLGGYILFCDGEDLIKVNESGGVEWRYHQPIGVISSVEVTPEGGVLLAGSWLNSFLYKVGSDGNEEWNKTMGSVTNGMIDLESVQNDPSGGFVLSGTISAFMSSDDDKGLIMKYSDDGEMIWANQYFGLLSGSFYSITPGQDSGYVAALLTVKDNPVFLKNSEYGYTEMVYIPRIAFLDDNGAAIGVRNAASEFSFVYYVADSATDGYYMSGLTPFGLFKENGYRIVKMNDLGEFVWENTFYDAKLTSVHPSSDGGLVISGIAEKDCSYGKEGESFIYKMPEPVIR